MVATRALLFHPITNDEDFGMAHAPSLAHIELTETFLRFYVLSVQYLDRMLGATGTESVSPADLQGHLKETNSTLTALLSINRVVKEKIEKEYHRVRALGDALSVNGTDQKPSADVVKAERDVLYHKMMALSDLLAALRAASLNRE